MKTKHWLYLGTNAIGHKMYQKHSEMSRTFMYISETSILIQGIRCINYETPWGGIGTFTTDHFQQTRERPKK